MMRGVLTATLDAYRPHPQTAFATGFSFSCDRNIKLNYRKKARWAAADNPESARIPVHFGADVIASLFLLGYDRIPARTSVNVSSTNSERFMRALHW
jgi:hypothetical protein